jgi:hypothetical protein
LYYCCTERSIVLRFFDDYFILTKTHWALLVISLVSLGSFIDFFIAMIIASENWKIIDSKIGDTIVQISAIVIADEKIFIDSQPCCSTVLNGAQPLSWTPRTWKVY